MNDPLNSTSTPNETTLRCSEETNEACNNGFSPPVVASAVIPEAVDQQPTDPNFSSPSCCSPTPSKDFMMVSNANSNSHETDPNAAQLIINTGSHLLTTEPTTALSSSSAMEAISPPSQLLENTTNHDDITPTNIIMSPVTTLPVSHAPMNSYAASISHQRHHIHHPQLPQQQQQQAMVEAAVADAVKDLSDTRVRPSEEETNVALAAAMQHAVGIMEDPLTHHLQQQEQQMQQYQHQQFSPYQQLQHQQHYQQQQYLQLQQQQQSPPMQVQIQLPMAQSMRMQMSMPMEAVNYHNTATDPAHAVPLMPLPPLKRQKLEPLTLPTTTATHMTTAHYQQQHDPLHHSRTTWEERLEQLRAYRKEHGDLLIPIRFKANPSLGKFVHNTREQYKLYHKQTPPGYKKKCSLTGQRIQQLDDLGFVWSTERSKHQNEDWFARFDQLKRYKEEHGDCLVPHGYTEDPSFAEWIHRQRTTYASMLKEASPNAMVQARMNQLSDMGFNFTVHADKWTVHWQELKEYRDQHGHCQVPTHYPENPKLGRWVNTQRHQRRLQLKGKKSCMTDERIALLNQLDFSWEVKPALDRPRTTWQQRFEELSHFVAQNRHFLIPIVTKPHLHAWCLDQRQRLNYLVSHEGTDASKRMGPDRVAALASIGFTKDVVLDMSGQATLSHSRRDSTGSNSSASLSNKDSQSPTPPVVDEDEIDLSHFHPNPVQTGTMTLPPPGRDMTSV